MQSKLIKGLLFVWIPLLFCIIPGLVTAFRDISSQKATGLGAVAGGLSEGVMTLALFGLFAIVACEIYAVILLIGTFSKRELLTRIVAIGSIACGTLFLIFLVFNGASFFWFMRSGGIR